MQALPKTRHCQEFMHSTLGFMYGTFTFALYMTMNFYCSLLYYLMK